MFKRREPALARISSTASSTSLASSSSSPCTRTSSNRGVPVPAAPIDCSALRCPRVTVLRSPQLPNTSRLASQQGDMESRVALAHHSSPRSSARADRPLRPTSCSEEPLSRGRGRQLGCRQSREPVPVLVECSQHLRDRLLEDGIRARCDVRMFAGCHRSESDEHRASLPPADAAVPRLPRGHRILRPFPWRSATVARRSSRMLGSLAPPTMSVVSVRDDERHGD